jgi:hypothetical protein
MKSRAILDQIARITYIADNGCVARFYGVARGESRALPPKKGTDNSIVGRMLLKNLRDEFNATPRRTPDDRARPFVAPYTATLDVVYAQRRQQCG